MTVIVALEHPVTGERAIAGDGRTTAGTAIITETRRKVLPMASGGFFGMSGEAAIGNAVEEALSRHDYTGIENLVSALRDAVEGDDDTFDPVAGDGGRPHYNFGFLAATSDGLWHIGCDFAYSQAPAGFPLAIGSGGGVAAGAALALSVEKGDWSAPEVCRRAVEIACRLDCSCGGEVAVSNLPRSLPLPVKEAAA